MFQTSVHDGRTKIIGTNLRFVATKTAIDPSTLVFVLFL